MKQLHETRESWLNAFVAAARATFIEHGYAIPDKVRVGIGFTSKGARSNAIGQCWSDTASGDGTFEIFIVPGQQDASRIAGILTHELIHAAVGLNEGHKGAFRKLALALGLEGKMTATTEGEEWHAWADPILETLGAFPHAPLDTQSAVTSGPKVQKNRHIKLECPDCGFICRASRTAIDAATYNGELNCPDPACDGFLRSE